MRSVTTLPPLIVALAIALVSGCSGDSTAATPEYGELDGPTVFAAGESLDSQWQALVNSSVPLAGSSDAAQSIQGFEPFNDPGLALSDGRFIVVGQWADDGVVESWVQRNPDSVAEDEASPERVDTSAPPVRVFVYDPENDGLQAVSHVPDVYPFSTAISIGETPDVVLRLVVVAGEHTVAYSTGFSGAAYDLERAIYLAPIPEQ